MNPPFDPSVVMDRTAEHTLKIAKESRVRQLKHDISWHRSIANTFKKHQRTDLAADADKYADGLQDELNNIQAGKTWLR